MKKTDEDHPINKRMKIGVDQDHAKENNSLMSNSGKNLLSDKKLKNSNQKLCKESMSFKTTLDKLNSFQGVKRHFKEKTKEDELDTSGLKLRRCDTELISAEIPFEQDETPISFETKEQMIEEIQRLRKDNYSLRSGILEKEKGIQEKHKKLESKKLKMQRFQDLSTKMEDSIKKLNNKINIGESKKSIIKDALIKYITKHEDQLKKDKRLWRKEQIHRIGRYVEQRVGHTGRQVWEEGEDYKKLRFELQFLEAEKEEMEKSRKDLSKRRSDDDGSDDAIAKNDTEYQKRLDVKEQKEILSFKINLNLKQIQGIRGKIAALEKEKVILIDELYRYDGEQKSKLGRANKNTYEILDQRYLILSLLGKGGYSEVYKAYDIENGREVACKIHHFDNNWSETQKANYIKHALRENKTHSELNHPRVVKQYDTVEIDNNTFGTIIELGTGPDLSIYLKEQGCLVEKEAKLIISQILSGLKYLNERTEKIIHYDLKPQNILFHNGEIKITDFGLGKVVEQNEEKVELTSQGVGTYWYQAPEGFEEGPTKTMINSKVDIWSVGVIFYELLYGVRPFGHNQSQKKILQEKTIINEAKQVYFPSKPGVSNETKQFIQKLLSYSKDERLSVEEAYFELLNK